MAKIRVRVRLNKGRIGIPLYKLGAIVKETEAFFSMLGQDVELPGVKKQWLGLDFENSSVAFSIEYVSPVATEMAALFATSIDDIRQGKPSVIVQDETRKQYARIARELDEDEIMDLGIYKDPESPLPEYFELSKRNLPPILIETQRVVESYGSVQGVIHSIFMGSKPRHFFIRELATEGLIKCVYTSEHHSELVKTLKEEGTVVHVYGLVEVDMAHRKISQITAERIDAAPKLSDNEFDDFFGCCPKLTGDLSTQEFIDDIRARND
jgi:hypothetical protein